MVGRAPNALLAAALAACTGGDPACRVGADCASGVCLSDGTCLTPADADPTAPDAAADQDAAKSADARPQGGRDAGPTACVPDHDGVVVRDEVVFAAGLSATFRVAQDAPVSTAGTPQPGGARRWDLAGALAGDHDVLVQTLAPAGAWWAADFPGATYAARLNDEDDLLGVFEARSDALVLLGIVSPTDGPTRTRLMYDPPVTVLAFPLASAATWSTEARVTGWALGVYGFYDESYTSLVDAAGELDTPFGTFPVLRVRVTLTRTVGFTVTTIRTFLFVSECFGTVAAIVSQPNESQVEFTNAGEVRRLSP